MKEMYILTVMAFVLFIINLVTFAVMAIVGKKHTKAIFAFRVLTAVWLAFTVVFLLLTVAKYLGG